MSLAESFVHLCLSRDAVQSVCEAARITPQDYPHGLPPLVRLYTCGEAVNARASEILHAWSLVMGGLPPSAFDITITNDFRIVGAHENVLAVRCEMTHLLESSVDAAIMETRRRVPEAAEPPQEPFVAWLELGECTILPDARELPPGFGTFHASCVAISGVDKSAGEDTEAFRMVGEFPLPEAEF